MRLGKFRYEPRDFAIVAQSGLELASLDKYNAKVAMRWAEPGLSRTAVRPELIARSKSPMARYTSARLA